MNHPQTHEQDENGRLNPREQRVWSYAVKGYTVKEIAEILVLEERTIETYLMLIEEKNGRI